MPHSSESVGEGKEYMFKRDHKSSIRLNYNHFTVKGTAGYLVHPSIPKDSPNLRIADVGTGTGIWAVEAANVLPDTVQIDCFDESDFQFPNKAFHPSNVRFHVQDCFKPFPSEYRETFDVLHIRFWLCIINDPDFKPLFENLLSILKPGGYLQWFEPLPLDSKVISSDPEAPQAAAAKIALSWYKPKPDSLYNWVYDMEKSFQEQGMTELVRDVHTVPDHLRPLWMQGCLAGIEDMISKIKVWDETAEATKRMMDDLEHEISRGVAVDTPFQCVVGRKPA